MLGKKFTDYHCTKLKCTYNTFSTKNQKNSKTDKKVSVENWQYFSTKINSIFSVKKIQTISIQNVQHFLNKK